MLVIMRLHCQAIGLKTGSAVSDYIALWNGDANRESLEAVQQTAAVIRGGLLPLSLLQWPRLHNPKTIATSFSTHTPSGC